MANSENRLPDEPEQEEVDAEMQAQQEEMEEEWYDSDPTPTPVKRQRPVWVGFVAILLCCYFLWSLLPDLFYFFVHGEPTDMGNGVEFTGTDLPDDSYVTITGIRNPSRGIHLNAAFRDRNLFQLMGTRLVFIETIVETDKKREGLHEEVFSGRLRRFNSLPYAQTLADFAAFNFGIEIEDQAVVIQAGEQPKDMWYAALFAGLLLLVILANVALIVRRLKARKG